MNVFYRYLRPKRFSEKRMELVTLPSGGICLRFEELPEGDLFFTYARCHPAELFNKEVARVIADDRAAVSRSDPRVMQHLRGLPHSQNTDLLVNEIICRCRQIDTTDEHPLIQRYMQMEYEHLADVLERLCTSNAAQERRGEAWKLGIQAVGRAVYEAHTK